jgi:uncharacterized protein (DUF433 family)
MAKSSHGAEKLAQQLAAPRHASRVTEAEALMNIDKAMQQSDLFNMNPRICIDPAVCHGKPVIRGSRFLVSTLLGALAGGDSVETILADYPSISREDIAAALEFASDLSDYQVSAYEAVA